MTFAGILMLVILGSASVFAAPKSPAESSAINPEAIVAYLTNAWDELEEKGVLEDLKKYYEDAKSKFEETMEWTKKAMADATKWGNAKMKDIQSKGLYEAMKEAAQEVSKAAQEMANKAFKQSEYKERERK